MRRRNFLVGLLTAVITFGSMFAIFGKERFNNGRHNNHEQCDSRNSCDDSQKKNPDAGQ